MSLNVAAASPAAQVAVASNAQQRQAPPQPAQQPAQEAPRPAPVPEGAGAQVDISV